MYPHSKLTHLSVGKNNRWVQLVKVRSVIMRCGWLESYNNKIQVNTMALEFVYQDFLSTLLTRQCIKNYCQTMIVKQPKLFTIPVVFQRSSVRSAEAC